MIKNKSKYNIALSEYINATCLHFTSFYFGIDSKLVLRKLYDMTEPNVIKDGVIKKLLPTMKSLQADMAELKSGATSGSNLSTDQSGRDTLPSNGRNVRGNLLKRCLSGEETGSSDDEVDGDEGDDTFRLSEEAMPSLRQLSSLDLMTLPGVRKRQSLRAGG